MSIKNKILVILETRKGEYISGEEIATELKISRTAIWKWIKDLRNDGHKINAVTNKGYSLDTLNDVLSVAGIKLFLQDQKLAENIVLQKIVDSTNQVAKKIAIDGNADKTIVLAEEQTAGKGRLGRSFFSPSAKGIYLSIVLKPNLNLENATLITTATAVAVCQAIEKVAQVKAEIKWVNDVLVKRKKVCGILTEAVLDFESGNIDYVIVGIGINFNNKKKDFPEDVQKVAGSVFSGDAGSVTRNQLVAEVVNMFFAVMEKVGDGKFMEEYKKRSVVLNQHVEFLDKNEMIAATAIDIDNGGELVVRLENGEIRSLNSGEVSVKGNFYHE